MVAVAKKKSNKVAMEFGNRLRQLREAHGLAVGEAAEAAGMAYSAYARLERGEREPSLSTLLKLAAALDVSPADLITEATE